MRKQIMLLMLSIILVFTFSACTGCNETTNSAEQEESSASSEEKATGTEADSSQKESEEASDTESDSSEEKAEVGSGSENSSSEEQGETAEPETGNFDGLDVQDETTIDMEEGQSVIVE